MRTFILLSVSLVALGCATTQTAEKPAAEPAALTFIEDDFGKALAQAKEKGVPLFVDTWAQW